MQNCYKEVVTIIVNLNVLNRATLTSCLGKKRRDYVVKRDCTNNCINVVM